jgi:hypothetical protein
MTFVYIFLFFMAVTLIGKIANGRNDKGNGRRGFRVPRDAQPFNRFTVDTQENPRDPSDGTSYGYKEFD